jgi:hypothetical protein
MQTYSPQDIARVVVERYDQPGAVKAGIVLTVIGSVMTVGGTLLFAQIGHSHDGLPAIGMPILTAGIGLGAGGIPLIVAGKREPQPMLYGAPGGLRINF